MVVFVLVVVVFVSFVIVVVVHVADDIVVIIIDPRTLTVKFGQNWVNNTQDITEVDFCRRCS